MMNQKEKEVIRELAKKVADCAQRPEMEERRQAWYAHNDLKSTDPMILVFPEGAWREILPPSCLLCEDEEAREMEWLLKARLFRGNHINDDGVIERNWEVVKKYYDTGWDSLNPNHQNSAFGNEIYTDSAIGGTPIVWKNNFAFNEGAMPFHPVIEKPEDLKRLKFPEIIYDEKATMEKLKLHQDVIGDILDVELVGKKYIQFALIETYSDFRGLEQIMYDLYDEPEMTHEAISFITEGYQDMVRQYLELGLLELNNNQAYNGSGGVGFTHDLPKTDGGASNLKNIWAFAESQEFTMVGPQMHNEFAIEYEKKLLEPFGLSSYGCCEPVENKLKYVLGIENMRRISVSPWANIEACAEGIGQKAVYSWKPNPSYFINNFEGDFLSGYVTNMLKATKNNCAEIVLKDTHTCQNDPQRFRKWTDLVRKSIKETR